MRSYNQNITQSHMGDYISLRPHGHKGNHGYMSLKGYGCIRRN